MTRPTRHWHGSRIAPGPVDPTGCCKDQPTWPGVCDLCQRPAYSALCDDCGEDERVRGEYVDEMRKDWES